MLLRTYDIAGVVVPRQVADHAGVHEGPVSRSSTSAASSFSKLRSWPTSDTALLDVHAVSSACLKKASTTQSSSILQSAGSNHRMRKREYEQCDHVKPYLAFLKTVHTRLL